MTVNNFYDGWPGSVFGAKELFPTKVKFEHPYYILYYIAKKNRESALPLINNRP